ncbi:MAG: methyltransferase domain-containing protein [Christensenellaceae bacterium]
MSDFIKDFWNSNAQKYKNSHQVSWGDENAIKLETQNIASFIKDGDRVLDVGCANGFAAIMQCSAHNLSSMTGIDFSENMIAYAQQNKQSCDFTELLNFEVGDVRDLQFADNTFDVVYTTRVIINLPNWQEQMTGLSECIRVAKPGGKIVFSEAFWEPLTRLNALRALGGLSPLYEHDFNRYLKQPRMEKFLLDGGYHFEHIDFSSIYYIGSRFLRELVTDFESFEGFSNPINKDFYEMEQKYSGGNFGIQQAYVVTK